MARLDAGGEDAVRIDGILEETGISRGSLYHHFGGRQGLVDAANLELYAQRTRQDLADLTRLVEQARTADDLIAAFRVLTEATQSPARRANRIQRARLVGQIGSGRFAAEFETVQHELNTAFASVIAHAQDKGTINPDLDPMALAVFIQAYTFGRVLGDLDTDPLDPRAWNALIDAVLSRTVRPDTAR